MGNKIWTCSSTIPTSIRIHNGQVKYESTCVTDLTKAGHIRRTLTNKPAGHLVGVLKPSHAVLENAWITSWFWGMQGKTYAKPRIPSHIHKWNTFKTNMTALPSEPNAKWREKKNRFAPPQRSSFYPETGPGWGSVGTWRRIPQSFQKKSKHTQTLSLVSKPLIPLKMMTSCVFPRESRNRTKIHKIWINHDQPFRSIWRVSTSTGLEMVVLRKK